MKSATEPLPSPSENFCYPYPECQLHTVEKTHHGCVLLLPTTPWPYLHPHFPEFPGVNCITQNVYRTLGLLLCLQCAPGPYAACLYRFLLAKYLLTVWLGALQGCQTASLLSRRGILGGGTRARPSVCEVASDDTPLPSPPAGR